MLMKVKTISIISAIAACVMLGSCYKDQSTEATQSFPDIVIENSGEPINIGYGQTLEMEPKVRQEGYGTSELTYHWEMDLRPNKTNNRLDLGTDLHLSFVVSNSPSNSPYNLTLTVTNPKLGISAISNWEVYVSNSMGEGLLVAYTRDDGVTSDLDLVRADNITYDAPSSPQYVRNLYSLSNDGATIDGEVRAMISRMASNGATYNEGYVIVGTDKEVLGLNSLDYTIDRKNADLFNNYSPETYRVDALFNYAGYISGIVVNNEAYAVVCLNDNYYLVLNYPTVTRNIFTADNVSSGALEGGFIAVFDETECKFASMVGWQAATASFTFCNFDDAFSLAGAKSLGAGCLNNQRNAFVIRDAEGKDHLCICDKEVPSNVTSYALTLPEVDDAVSFAFCDNSDIFYYATPSKIYATVLSGSVTVTQPLTWAPDSADERITMIQHYRQAWYGSQRLDLGYAFSIPTNRTQVVIVTHNDKTGEGKIYLRGFNVSTGKFTMTSNGTFDGFGRITAVAPTMR